MMLRQNKLKCLSLGSIYRLVLHFRQCPVFSQVKHLTILNSRGRQLSLLKNKLLSCENKLKCFINQMSLPYATVTAKL